VSTPSSAWAAALLDADLTAQGKALARGDTSAEALTQAALGRIAAQTRLNAFIHLDAASALAAAQASDNRRARGQTLGPLDGLGLGVKDNIDVAGWPTTAGMATRRGRIAAQDAFVVQRLRAAGMVLLGKLNMHEAALGATNDNPFYGRCEHPQRAGYTPGGSSGGSACAVAAGLCAVALGTDTMGSVRLPAAYCGVVGFKAGFGLISTGGSVACGYALDHIGPLVRSQRDLALVLPVLVAHDLACADSRAARPLPPLAQPRLGWVRDVSTLGTEPEVAAAYAHAIARLVARGHTLVAVPPPPSGPYHFSRARRAGLLMVEADLLLEHAEDWRAQPQHFSPELAQLLRYAERQGATALAAAQRVVAQAQVEVARWFSHCDVMLLPTTPHTAFAFGSPVPANQADFTSIANMAGIPALSVPLPVALGELPIGLQALAPAGHETTLLGLTLTAGHAQ
jgi:Asp-tRNA(Asn)/Glu-tRNA(Gln) amidotransferase A subunit family amidase